MKQIRFLLFCLLLVFSCSKEDNTLNTVLDTPEKQQTVTDLEFQQANFGDPITASFLGIIKDVDGLPLENVLINAGNQSTNTNNQGVFILNNVSSFEKFAYLKALKEGYIIGSRTIVPKADDINIIEIILLKENITQTISSGINSIVTLPNGVEVEFSGDFIDSNNNSYNGQVNVSLNYIEPNQNDTFNRMPGMLFGRRSDGSGRGMETYGMINVTLSSTNGEELNIAPNSPATITYPISSTTPNTPQTIPLWSFNDMLGYWEEEGTAIKYGNEYIATVNHFSWWNIDVPLNTIIGCINLNYNNENLADFTIEILRNVNNQVIYSGSSNSLGNLCGLIPKNETLIVKIYANSVCNNNLIQIEEVGPFLTDTDLNITINNFPNTLGNTLITGIINDCNNQSITDGYAFIYSFTNSDSKFVGINNGELNYNFSHCSNSDYLIVFRDNNTNQTTDPISLNLQNNTLNLTTVSTCNTSGGIFSGNVTLRTQADVNFFGSFNYTSIDGNLTIGEFNNDITSLLPLQSISNVTQTIKIYGTQLNSLQGLNNLITINDLIISENDILTSLEGLNNLTTTNNFYIFYNNMLTSLQGLNSLTTTNNLEIYYCKFTSLEGLNNLTTTNNFRIEYNSLLYSLEGLDNLVSTNNLTILGNNTFTSLTGLNNLTTTNEFKISYNNNLTSLEGLNNLTSTSELTIRDNDALINLEGLDNLTSINGIFTIYNNNNLISLEGLDNLLTTPQLSISQNDVLASLNGLNNLTAVGATLAIYENNSLVNLDALNNLTTTGSILIRDNNILINLEGLNNLTTINDTLWIYSNNNLSDFCSLTHLCTNGTYSNINITNNSYNPTIQNIIDGNCSQ